MGIPNKIHLLKDFVRLVSLGNTPSLPHSKEKDEIASMRNELTTLVESLKKKIAFPKLLEKVTLNMFIHQLEMTTS